MPSVPRSQSPRYGSPEEIARHLTDGYWEDRGGVRHAFDAEDGVLTVDLSMLDGAGRQLARWALEAWELVADIAFSERTGDVDIAFDDAGSGAQAEARWYETGETISARVTIGAGWIEQYGSTIDSYGFNTYLHEIGHALGLGHPGDYDGDAVYARDATYRNDSWQLSVMSYFDQEQNTAIAASRAEPITAMPADIIAIQDLYGASTRTAGATIWGPGSDIGGYLGDYFDILGGAAGPSGLYDGRPVALAIHDQGGTDTLNLSGSTTDDRVSLFQGGISDIGGSVGNLVIAEGTLIENLSAGSGSDLALGNAAANEIFAGSGHDTVWAGGGDDGVYGGSGRDLLGGGDGADGLYGGADDDRIWGNAGDDRLGGGDGDDRVSGQGGDDGVYGAAGRDLLSGGWGRDTIWSGTGDDVADGGAGDDLMGGGLGADLLTGGAGEDTIFGFRDDDEVRGEGGGDVIWGGAGEDVLRGGTGGDTLYGAAGNDVIDGEWGDDALSGGPGADSFVFAAFYGRDAVTDFALAEGDRLRLDAGLWTGALDDALDGGQVVARFAASADGGTVLDFGDFGALTLADVADRAGLAGAIDII